MALFTVVGFGAGVGSIIGGIFGQYSMLGGAVGAGTVGLLVMQVLVEYVRPYLRQIRSELKAQDRRAV